MLSAEEPGLGTVCGVTNSSAPRPKRPKAYKPPKAPVDPVTAKRNKVMRFGLAIALAAAFVAFAGTQFRGSPTPPEEVSLNEILSMVDESGERGAVLVDKAEIDDESRVVTLTTEDGTKLYAGYPLFYGVDLANALTANDIAVKIAGPQRASLLSTLIPTVFLLVGLGLVMLVVIRKHARGVGKFGSGSNTGPVELPAVRFSDVIGADEAVADLGEVVDYLQDPSRFDVVGARAPHGVLLVGPPGTGKTLLARAVAGEAGVAFFAVSGSDFNEMFVGVGARRARDLFSAAKKFGKAVIFIDEIDGIGRRRRGAGSASGASDERDNTLNALLVAMDGFETTNIVVIAATNRADMLDPALVRPGRFDRQVQVVAPDRIGRQGLFELYLRDKRLGGGVDPHVIAERFAHRTPGMTGAEIDNLTNEAALAAARDNSPVITEAHLEEGLERVALGPASSALVTDRARLITAWHEAGHTVMALVQDQADKPKRVSIVPRGAAGGVTWFGGNDDEGFATRGQIEARMVVLYGGRAAEELILDGDFTRGAASDIAAATTTATAMVCAWGMSDLGPVRLDADHLTGETAESVRIEVVRLCNNALNRARALVAEHRALLQTVAEALLARENLNEDDLVELQTAEVELAAMADAA
jgi:cell division protease FtsH